MTVHIYGICFSEDMEDVTIFNITKFTHSESMLIKEFKKETQIDWTRVCVITDVEDVYYFYSAVKDFTGENQVINSIELKDSFSWVVPLAYYIINNPNQTIEL